MTKRDTPLERAAMRCIDKQGYAFRIAAKSIARTYFINEKAFLNLEYACARHAAAKKGKQ